MAPQGNECLEPLSHLWQLELEMRHAVAGLTAIEESQVKDLGNKMVARVP